MKKMKNKVSFLFVFLVLLISFSYSQFFPYYGKNKVQTNKDWLVYESDNFKIHFYTKKMNILDKTVLYSEQAYDKLSEFLGYSTEDEIPMILYQSHKDFEMTNLYPGALPESVQGFSEPVGNRIVIPSEFPDEQLKHLIVHELTHIFQFEIIYKGSKINPNRIIPLPLWIMEGFAEFIPGEWEPLSTMVVRDAVVNGNLPLLNKYGSLSGSTSARSPYDFGHLIYDFLYKNYGKTGVRKFWWNLRKFSLFKREHILKDAFDLEIPVFNSKFQRYARERYKEYFSKKIPVDYGLKISPEFPYMGVFSYSMSPSQQSAAVVTADYSALAIRVALINLRTGEIYKNITPGYSSKFENIYMKFDPADGRSIAWDSKGDYIAFFGRYNFNYFLLFYSSEGKFLRKVKLENLNEPSGIDISKDDKYVVFSAIKEGQRDIFLYDIKKDKFIQLTKDENYEFSPSFSKDNRKIVFSEQINGNHQLFMMSLEDKSKIRLTFNKTEHINPRFLDDNNIIFSYYNNDVYNLAILDISKKKNQILTDLSTGAFYPQKFGEQYYYLGYSNGNFSLYKSSELKPVKQIDEKIEKEEIQKEKQEEKTPERRISQEKGYKISKGKIEPYNMFDNIIISGLPSIGIAVATDGTTYGGTYLNLTDTLNNHSLSVLAYNVLGYKNYDLTYINLSSRFDYGIELFSRTYFYYLPQYYWASSWVGYYSYKDAIAKRTLAGGNFIGIYPINKFHRLTFRAGVIYQDEELANLYFPSGYVSPFYNGWSIPAGISLTGETTSFRSYGPYRGYTYNINFSRELNFLKSLRDAYAVRVDLRKYFPIGSDFLFAFQGYGEFSGGEEPYIFYGGGNNEIRSTNYYTMAGNNYFHINAEFRFPLINLAATPIGLIGPVRGVVFADAGGAWFKGQDFQFIENGKLKDAIGSVGYGVEFFLGGYPIHIEWVHRTDYADFSDDEVNFWIGFDF